MDDEVKLVNASFGSVFAKKLKAIWAIVTANSYVVVTDWQSIGAVKPSDAETILEYYQPTMNNLIAAARDYTRKHPS